MHKRPFNFSAGPATMPETVLQQAATDMLNWQGSGMGVMEMSHRGKEFMAIATQAHDDIRDVLAVPLQLQLAAGFFVTLDALLQPTLHHP